MLCAKYNWYWPTGSGEEDFKNSSMYFRYFVIISPWKRTGPFIWTNWIPFTQVCFVLSLVEIGPMVLEKKKKIWKVFNDDDNNDDGQRTNCDPKSTVSLWLIWANRRIRLHYHLKNKKVFFRLGFCSRIFIRKSSLPFTLIDKANVTTKPTIKPT